MGVFFETLCDAAVRQDSCKTMTQKNTYTTALHRMKKTLAYYFLFIALSIVPISVAHSHAKGENYVWINVELDHISGRFELRFDDLKSKLGIDVDAIGPTRQEGVRAAQAEVRDYLKAHFSISDASGEMMLEFSDAQLFEEDSRFIQYPYRIGSLPRQNKITVRNRIFLTPDLMSSDRLHRSVIVVEYNKAAGSEYGDENVAMVFGPDVTEREIDLADPATVLEWRDFLKQGLLHIAIGLDHIVFILLILLTVVLHREGKRWKGQPDFAAVLWKALKVITTFTVAHSITLSLAAVGLVSFNTTMIEIIIALSIMVLAIANMLPISTTHNLILIFAFGLFHGLGFASVMGDLQFRTVLMERILLLFNVGVEIGQVLIAVVLLPLLYLIRNHPRYHTYVVIPVSLISACIATYWVAQRAGLIA